MMRRMALLTAIVLGSLTWTNRAHSAQDFSILVPRFAGPAHLTDSVSAFLALQLWTTFRAHPTPNPDNLDFGSATVKWSKSALSEASSEFALEAATGTNSQMVLWGFAGQYGPGVVVQAYLTVPKASGGYEPGTGVWLIKDGAVQLALGLPDHSFQFSPLLLSDAVVSKYSQPDEIRICPTKKTTCDGPPLGKANFKAARQEQEWAEVRQGDYKGWVYIPDLSSAQTEVLDFTAGIIAYIRLDFEQAYRLLSTVAASKADSVLRFDASVIAGIAQARRGLSGTQELRQSLEANPYSRYAAQALLMAYFASMADETNNDAKRALVGEAEKLLASYAHLFVGGDPWLTSAQAILQHHRPN